eukprot:7196311-Pyramimonas_sp.AAC.1
MVILRLVGSLAPVGLWDDELRRVFLGRASAVEAAGVELVAQVLGQSFPPGSRRLRSSLGPVTARVRNLLRSSSGGVFGTPAALCARGSAWPAAIWMPQL